MEAGDSFGCWPTKQSTHPAAIQPRRRVFQWDIHLLGTVGYSRHGLFPLRHFRSCASYQCERRYSQIPKLYFPYADLLVIAYIL